MDTSQLIDKYLTGNRPDVPHPFPQAPPEQLRQRHADTEEWRRQLVLLGPPVVLPALRSAPPEMRQAVMSISSFIASMNPQLFEQVTKVLVWTIFRNIHDLIRGIGSGATDPLVEAMRDRDPEVRALAVRLAQLPEVWSPSILAAVQARFSNERDPLVRVAAAVTLVQPYFATDQRTRRVACLYIEQAVGMVFPYWRPLGENHDVLEGLIPWLIAIEQ